MSNLLSILKFSLYRLKRKIIKSSRSIYSWRDKIPYYFGLKKAEKGSMPDFIIAGLPKCGTVWLVEALNAHSDFDYVRNPFFSHKGEIRFFSFNFDHPISIYLDTFKKRREGPKKFLFEKSPDYSTMSTWRIRLIKRLNPSIKIILIFREPIQRAFSNTKMGLIRRRNIALSPENDHLFFNSYKAQTKKYNYERVIKNWYSIFEESQILILSMEDIRDRPEEVLKKSLEFLSSKYEENNFDLWKPKNVTISDPIPDSHREYLQNSLSSTIHYWESNQSLFRL